MSGPDVVAIVLAGGASSRFGSDKLGAVLDGRPLLHHALEAVAEVAGRIIVVASPDAPAPSMPPALVDRVTIARDMVAYAGPLAGLAAGLAAGFTAVRDERPRITLEGPSRFVVDERPRIAQEEPPRIALVVGGDMPSLVSGVLRLLLDSLAADPGLAAMTLAASPEAPLPMVVRPSAVSVAVGACLAAQRRSLRALLDAVPSARVPESAWRTLDPGGRTLADVDRPEDLRPEGSWR